MAETDLKGDYHNRPLFFGRPPPISGKDGKKNVICRPALLIHPF